MVGSDKVQKGKKMERQIISIMYYSHYHYPISIFLSLLDKEPLKTHIYIVTSKERKAIKTLSCEKFSVSENSGV